MNNINEQITSIRSAVGASYSKPSPKTVEEQIIQLNNSPNALDYLRNTRGFSDETIKSFNLGYDSKRNAISIPIFKNGELVNIKYRNLNPEEHGGAKYKSTYGAENWVFNDSGLSVGKEKGRVLIVEGEFDCISAVQRGLKNVISPSLGKESYGVWIETLDNIPEVYIAYDNDKPGKDGAKKLAERIGIEKCKEITYPDDVKDTNEFFTKYTTDDFKKIIKEATPFYNYDFVNVSSLLDSMRDSVEETIKSELVPQVNIGKDWLIIISGPSNAGKTSYCMNIASELSEKKVPVLILPFERGIETVGKRFLQVRYNMTEADFVSVPEADWKDMKNDSANLPVYFSRPNREELFDTIKRSKRIFGTEIVIIDHLDYMVRGHQNKNDEMAKVLQDFKEFAMDNKVILLVVHHLKKLGAADPSDPFAGKRTPTLEDLKGSSNLYQDPECVVMLYVEKPDTLTVDIQKNKGKMTKKTYPFSAETGKILLEAKPVIKTDVKLASKEQQMSIADEIFFGA